MPSTWYDLLSEPLLRVRAQDGASHRMSLPAVLKGLGDCQVESFQSLQVHQQHAWYSFLVQLAALAIHRAGILSLDAVPSGDAGETFWREALLTLSVKRHEPWCLVVQDLGQAAFFQPPVPEG